MSTLLPTMILRWVDKSPTPDLYEKKTLQQRFIKLDGKDVWVDVPHVGHISKIGKTTCQKD